MTTSAFNISTSSTVVIQPKRPALFTASSVGSTAAFEPSIRPVAASITTASTAALVGRVPANGTVVLLMHMDVSSPAFIDETGKTVTTVGNTTTNTTPLPFSDGNTAAGYFDGTGDYLQLANSTDFAFVSGEFTVEMWVRPTTLANKTLYAKRTTSSGFSPLLISTLATGAVQVSISATGSSYGLVLTSSGAGKMLVAGTYSHIAVTSIGGWIYLYVNGLLAASGARPGSFLVTNSAPLCIGADTNGLSFAGHIDEIRVVKGAAKYLGDFTPPNFAHLRYGVTAEFGITTGSSAVFPQAGDAPAEFYIPVSTVVDIPTALANTNTAFLFHMDGADGSSVFVDECSNHVVNIGSPVISTAQGKFSSQSGLFDASSWLEVHGTLATFDLDTDDFLVEAWVRPTSLADGMIFGYGAINSAGDLDRGAFKVLFLSTGKVAVITFPMDAFVPASLSSTTTLALNTWTHVAFGGVGGNTSLFINGVREVAFSGSVERYQISSSYDYRILVGKGFTGYLDEVRFTNGRHPYYDSADPFRTFSQPSPFRIIETPRSAYSIATGSAFAFTSPDTGAANTTFSIATATTLDLKVIGLRDSPAAFSISAGATTSFAGWLLIGATSYFDILTGSDFWFISPSEAVLPPRFIITGESRVRFNSPSKTRKSSKFSSYPRTSVRMYAPTQKPLDYQITPGSFVCGRSGQNALAAFSCSALAAADFAGASVSRRSFIIDGHAALLFDGNAPTQSILSALAGSIFLGKTERRVGASFLCSAASNSQIYAGRRNTGRNGEDGPLGYFVRST